MNPLSRVPGLGGFLAGQEQQERSEALDLQRAATLQSLLENVRARQQQTATREALAQSGGDPEKAIPLLLQAGDVAGAKSLGALLEEQRKANAPRVVAPGSQVLGKNNEVLHTAPFAPQRQQAMPEFVNLLTIRDSLPEGHPMRADLDARIRHMRGEGSGGARSPFGTGATGGALDIMTRLARGYGAGVTTDDESREFEAAITHYTQPRQYQNPDTGLLETRRPELPPFVQEAVNQRRGARPSPSPAPGPGPAAPQPALAARAPGQKTIWELTSLTAGPIPAAGEIASRTPVLGEFFQAPQFTQARNQVRQMQRELVRVLQNNPRYSEGERRAIEKDIDIEPRGFDTPQAARNRLIGIDRALQIRERNAFETANSARVGRDERIQAMNVLNGLRQFRQSLNVPPTIRGDERYEELPEEFIDPEGNYRRKRK